MNKLVPRAGDPLDGFWFETLNDSVHQFLVSVVRPANTWPNRLLLKLCIAREGALVCCISASVGTLSRRIGNHEQTALRMTDISLRSMTFEEGLVNDAHKRSALYSDTNDAS